MKTGASQLQRGVMFYVWDDKGIYVVSGFFGCLAQPQKINAWFSSTIIDSLVIVSVANIILIISILLIES